MSSTTDRDRGQVLVLFAGGLFGIFMVAALAFDTGTMLVEMRDQQNAADAAAIAGARWLPADKTAAEASARDLATANGFTDGVGSERVSVNIPPTSGEFSGRAGYIQVQIASTRPSIFAGLMGVGGWDVGAGAVATNQSGVAGPFAMLALHPSDCDSLLVTGTGAVNSFGNIQVNSTCANSALRAGGQGTININVSDAACNVVGGWRAGGGASINPPCNSPEPAIPDPLAGVPEPDVPDLAAAVRYISGTKNEIPPGCPGSSAPATEEEPAICQFNSSYSGTVWRLYPGFYPGGLKLLAGTFYLEPGIYYIGGGGFTVTGNGATALSVAPGGTTLGGGIMIFNSEIPGSDGGVIDLNGAQANIDFYPLADSSLYDGLVIFQDRDFNAPGDDVTINGSASVTLVRGTIYVPTGEVKINGNGGTVTTDQIIASKYKLDGNGGNINVLYDEDFLYTLTAAGLVE